METTMQELPFSFKLFANVCVWGALALVFLQEEITNSINVLTSVRSKRELSEAISLVASIFARRFDFIFRFAANFAVAIIACGGIMKNAFESKEPGYQSTYSRKLCAAKLSSGRRTAS